MRGQSVEPWNARGDEVRSAPSFSFARMTGTGPSLPKNDSDFLFRPVTVPQESIANRSERGAEFIYYLDLQESVALPH